MMYKDEIMYNDELSKLYPNKAQWEQAVMDCVHSRGKHLGNLKLSVDELWDKSLDDVIKRYKELGSKQPAPTLNNNPSVHDLVIIDLIQQTDGNHLLAKGLWDRKRVGLETYGTPLQAFNGRDCEQDAVEEILDYICYLKQSLLEGKSYLEPIYHRSIALAVDQMNLTYINKEEAARKALVDKAPYHHIILEVDGVVQEYHIQELTWELAARIALDEATLGAERAIDKVLLLNRPI